VSRVWSSRVAFRIEKRRADLLPFVCCTSFSEEAEKVKLEDEKEAPKPHPFFPPPPPSVRPLSPPRFSTWLVLPAWTDCLSSPLFAQTYTPQANRSATPEIIPPTTINDEGKTNPTSTEPQGPVKKFLFSPEMKKILWALHLNNVHMMESANEIAKYTPGTAELTLTPLNKQLYADVSLSSSPSAFSLRVELELGSWARSSEMETDR